MLADNPTRTVHPWGRLRKAFPSVVSALLVLACSHPPAPATSNVPRDERAGHRPGPQASSGKAEGNSPWLVATDPDLRRLTVAIRVPPPPPLARIYTALAQSRTPYSSVLLAHAEGGFGSGFILVRRSVESTGSPRPYIVTNQHVVGLAEDVEILFDGATAGTAGRVVHVDEIYDLALIELTSPDLPPIEAGLELETRPAQDQDVIIAVGFPGIAGQPSYQITRGTISNKSLKLPLDGELTPHIQHTAPIDPGSSGGPLLSEDNRVVGINTLKVFGREGVGLAVPASAIESAFDLLLTKSLGSPHDFRGTCLRLVDELSSEESLSYAAASISAGLAAERGVESLSFLPEGEEDWPEIFGLSPDDLLVYAIALRLRAALTQVTPGEPTCHPKSDGSPHTFEVATRPSPLRLTFTIEQNRPKLARVSLPKTQRPSFLTPRKAKKWKPSL